MMDKAEQAARDNERCFLVILYRFDEDRYTDVWQGREWTSRGFPQLVTMRAGARIRDALNRDLASPWYAHLCHENFVPTELVSWVSFTDKNGDVVLEMQLAAFEKSADFITAFSLSCGATMREVSMREVAFFAP